MKNIRTLYQIRDYLYETKKKIHTHITRKIKTKQTNKLGGFGINNNSCMNINSCLQLIW